MRGTLHIKQADCIAEMKTYPDNFFDLGVVDPPYGNGDWIPQNKTRHGRKYETQWKAEDYLCWNVAPSEEYWTELKRVTKDRIVWGANYLASFEGKKGAIVWNKGVKAKYFSKCEIASVTQHKRVELANILWQNINRPEDTIHPCQKPISLYTWIYERYTKPGFKILDTHLGSGSSAIAAYQMNLEFWGYEISDQYFSKTMERINSYRAQLPLF